MSAAVAVPQMGDLSTVIADELDVGMMSLRGRPFDVQVTVRESPPGFDKRSSLQET